MQLFGNTSGLFGNVAAGLQKHGATGPCWPPNICPRSLCEVLHPVEAYLYIYISTRTKLGQADTAKAFQLPQSTVHSK